MNRIVMAVLSSALVGLLALSSSALAQQKTSKQCNDEWAADKAAVRASGKTKRMFVAECRGLEPPAPKASAKSVAAPTGAGQFATEGEAKASCPNDAVVWVNQKSKIYHTNNSRSYGSTKLGAYMCEKDSAAAGFRAPKTPRRDVSGLSDLPAID
jgi:hypothetical protein